MVFHFFEQGGVVGCSVGVDNVEDTLARNDEAVAEALAFGAVFAQFVFWILAFIVASEVSDDIRVLRLGENERRRVVGFKVLRSGYGRQCWQKVGRLDLPRTKCRTLQKAYCQRLYQPDLLGSVQHHYEER